MADKTSYRKAFNSPYLSSVDIVEPLTLTVARAALERDRAGKDKSEHNTVYFVQKEIRPGEALKPMIFNVTNSKTMSKIAGSIFLEDWANHRVTVYVDTGVKFGRETVDGLRIMPARAKPALTPDNKSEWAKAKSVYAAEGNLDRVLAKRDISDDHMAQLKAECDVVA